MSGPGPLGSPEQRRAWDLITAYARERLDWADPETLDASEHTAAFMVWLAVLEPVYFAGLCALVRTSTKPEVLAEQAQSMREFAERNPLPRMEIPQPAWSR